MADRLAVTMRGVVAIMNGNGYTWHEIEAYLNSAAQPTEGYFYMDEIPHDRIIDRIVEGQKSKVRA